MNDDQVEAAIAASPDLPDWAKDLLIENYRTIINAYRSVRPKLKALPDAD